MRSPESLISGWAGFSGPDGDDPYRLQRFPALRPAVPLDEFHWTYRTVLRALNALPVYLR